MSLLRIAMRLVIGLALLAVGGLIAVFWQTDRQLRQDFSDDVPVRAMRFAAGDPAEGARLTKVLGCVGCHGDTLAGDNFFGIATANLTDLPEEYDLPRFARLLRSGIRPDGTSVTWSMPSDFFAIMADDQVAHIHAYLRSLSPQPNASNGSLMPIRHLGLALGELTLSTIVQRGEDVPARAPLPADPAFGAYFARIACAECHGYDLRGFGDTPSLRTAVDAYDLPAFRTLLKTGTSVGGVSDLRLMSGVARGRLAHMRDEEVAALHVYLRSLPD